MGNLEQPENLDNSILRLAPATDAIREMRVILSKLQADSVEGVAGVVNNPADITLAPSQFLEINASPTAGRLYRVGHGTKAIIRCGFTDSGGANTAQFQIWRVPLNLSKLTSGADLADVRVGFLPENISDGTGAAATGTTVTFDDTLENANLSFGTGGQVIVHTNGAGGTDYYLSEPVEFELRGCPLIFATWHTKPAAGDVALFCRVR